MERLSLSLEKPLADSIRRAARAKATTLSAWLAQPARKSLALECTTAVVAAYEREHGELTAEELATAEHQWRG